MKTSFLLLLITFTSSCLLINSEQKSCYRIKQKKVYLRYYGGYPRAKEVFLEVKGADARSFKYIEGSREGACQRGHIFGKDNKNIYYRTSKIMFADTKSFEVLNYGYSKDKDRVFYKNEEVEKSDAKSFFVIKNKRKQPYGADRYSLIINGKRKGSTKIDTKSFELLPKPYSKDKNNVYYTEDFIIVDKANPKTFTCPKFKSIVNYQYYAYDDKNAYYYEKKHVYIIPNIDFITFTALNSEYAKDKNGVYYKWNKIPEADPATFHIPNNLNRRIGQDKNHKYIEGVISE